MTNARFKTVALWSAISTYFFWIEYLPPFKRVHLPDDAPGFHWPLFVSAFEAIRHGRIPLWDPSIYCGIPFAGNIQAALFYPPTWLLFLVNLRSRHVLFKSVEAWIFLHAWIAFLLCFLWLRRRFGSFASVLGAAVFAFSGYMVSQNSHIGIVTGYTWTPLAWMAIDQTVEGRSWRPMWKVVLASALCFLAGYPASFAAFAVATVVYAAGRSWRVGLAAIAAVVVSLALAAVQFLPTLEAASLKTADPKYGPGIWDPLFYVHFLVPDWVGFQRGDPHLYLYLGAPALFGLPWLFKRPDRALLAVLSVCALLMTNPREWVSTLVQRSALLVQIFPMLSMVEPATLVFAYGAATGADAILQSKRTTAVGGRLQAHAMSVLIAATLLCWSLYRMGKWPDAAAGWRSVAGTCVTLTLFAAGLSALRSARIWLAIAVLAAVFVDYKVAGTSRPFSAVPGDIEPYYPRDMFLGTDPQAYDFIRAHRQYRVAVAGVHATEIRRYGLATPQGFDPLLPEQYKVAIERHKSFVTNRLFDIHPTDKELVRRLGVRFFLVRSDSPLEAQLAADSEYRLVGRSDFDIRTYEYTRAVPPWRCDAGDAIPIRWEGERREFELRTDRPGRFVMVEQYYPGWRAFVDDRPTPIERSDGTFQSVLVPAGLHTLSFLYRPTSLLIGATVSLVSLTSLFGFLWITRNHLRS
jgi:hypothetical protein